MKENEDNCKQKSGKLMNEHALVVHSHRNMYMATLQATISVLMDSSSDDEDDD